MDSDTLKVIKETIAESIKVTVNGKIDTLHRLVEEHNTKHEADYREVKEHMESVKPILEAYNGGKAVGNLLKWLGGIIVTVAAAWALIFKQ